MDDNALHKTTQVKHNNLLEHLSAVIYVHFVYFKRRTQGIMGFEHGYTINLSL